MPRLNFTFQESSPLITYTGFWTDNSHNDSAVINYDGSFRATNSTQPHGTATFNFVGTGVSIFGAKRGNHGSYSVNLDHGNVTTQDGFSKPDLFRQLLWEAHGLDSEEHNVEISNESDSPAPYFDLDFVTIERVIGSSSDTVFLSILDDTGPSVQYTGPWQQSSVMSSQNMDGTIHMTIDIESGVTISFHGCCIELYGLYANAAYTVSLDDGPPSQIQGMDVDVPQNMWYPQTLLYFVDGLEEGINHTVTLETTQASLQRPFSFDYALVRSTYPSILTSIPPSTAASPSSGNKTAGSHLRLTIGVSIGAIVLLALLATIQVLLVRRRRRRSALSTAEPYNVSLAYGERNSLEPIRGQLPPNALTMVQTSSLAAGRIDGAARKLSSFPSHVQIAPIAAPENRGGSLPANTGQRKSHRIQIMGPPVSSVSHRREVQHSSPAQREGPDVIREEVTDSSILPPAYTPGWVARN